MNATKGLTQLIFWSIFVLAVIGIIGAWYVAVGLITAIMGLTVYLVRRQKAKVAKSSLETAVGDVLAPSQIELTQNSGFLDLDEGSMLRVVETATYSENLNWLARKYQVERAETIEMDGFVTAGVEWIEDDSGGEEHEVIYVSHENRVLGRFADVDLPNWYDEILEVGGSARCKLKVKFGPSSNVTSIEVRGL